MRVPEVAEIRDETVVLFDGAIQRSEIPHRVECHSVERRRAFPGPVPPAQTAVQWSSRRQQPARGPASAVTRPGVSAPAGGQVWLRREWSRDWPSACSTTFWRGWQLSASPALRHELSPPTDTHGFGQRPIRCMPSATGETDEVTDDPRPLAEQLNQSERRL